MSKPVLAFLGTAALLCSSAYAQSEHEQRIKLNRNLTAGDEKIREAQSGTTPGGQTPLLDHHGPVLQGENSLWKTQDLLVAHVSAGNGRGYGDLAMSGWRGPKNRGRISLRGDFGPR